MVMLAEQYEFVIGGDPDRDTIDLAVVHAGTGAVRSHCTDRADRDGYERLLAWVDQHAPGRRVWALEGTGSFAAGLAMALAEAGEDVVEVSGGKRSPGAKNDRIDAIRAARAALEAEHHATPRARGLREALRQVLVTRQAVLVSRTKAINELKSLIIVAPEHLRAQLRGASLATQLARINAMKSPAGASVEHRVTVMTLNSIAARIQFLTAQIAALDPELVALVKEHQAGPALLAEPGVGPVVAAQLLVSWSHRGRVRSEAAFASLAGTAPSRPAAASGTGIASAAVATATSTVRSIPSRSPGSAATPSPEPTKPSARPTARRTATSAVHLNVPSLAASTDASKPPQHQGTHRPAHLTEHRSVQRAPAPVLSQGSRPVRLHRGRPQTSRAAPQQQAQGIGVEDTGRRIHVRTGMIRPPVLRRSDETA